MAKSTLFVSLLLLLSLATAYAHGGGSHDDDADAGADDGEKPNLRSRSLILTKVWCLIVVFFATFAGGVSPYFLKWNEAFLVLGTQFAGGVFLGTAMIHFLSDSNETFEDLTGVDYPFAFMLACAGFAITLLADCIISAVVSRGRSVRDMENGGISPQQRKSNIASGDSHTQQEVGRASSDHSVPALLRDASSLGDNILLIAALCFHSVFEGIAIGVAETKADAWRALWTISLHKVFAAIAMGIALLRMMPNRPFLSCVVYSFAFAISSPIGVAIGIIIDATTQGHVADWIYAISMGLACGIFIYVSINHLLAKGYKPRKPVAADTAFMRWLAVVLGIGVIAVVMIWD
ncbi:zinc transporter 2 [Canna indica]|uniref:Zinc transporter 2 n=1 Tax=Canna indica TaxID=4628 RepID=A0AAQ3QIT3_9LILI|nr:zinc transporter 2 [Canna indica]